MSTVVMVTMQLSCCHGDVVVPVQCDAPDLSGVNNALTDLKLRNQQMQKQVEEMTEIVRGLSTCKYRLYKRNGGMKKFYFDTLVV